MSILDRVDQSVAVEDRYPFLPSGTHVVAVLSIYEFRSLKHGPSVATEWLVVESNNPAVRKESIYANMFLVSRAPKFPNDQQELDRLVNYCGKLAGAEDHEGNKKAAKDILTKQDIQPARGKLITVHCVDKPQMDKRTSTQKTSADGKPLFFTERMFEHYPQSMEELAKFRTEIDKRYPLRQRNAPAAQPAPQPAAPSGVPLSSFFGR